MARFGLITRFRLLGPVSILALFAGGVILILVGVNTSLAPTWRKDGQGNAQSGTALYDNQARFRFGSSLNIQTWVAIIGVGFGMLAYGFNEAYNHLFDAWCSWAARKETGLDYGRYLNSQSRAPVQCGIRGFPAFTILKLIFAISSIAASLGYKFAVLELPILSYENLDRTRVQLTVPPLEGLNNGISSPWFGDVPQGNSNRAFTHQVQPKEGSSADSAEEDWDPNLPPISIIMAGWANCSGLFRPRENGYVISRETVMVANMTEEQGDFVMTSNSTGWMRTETSNNHWLNSTGHAVVDYRVLEPGRVQIQWTQAGSWLNDPAQSTLAAHRLTYSLHYAVGLVGRGVEDEECSAMFDLGILNGSDGLVIVSQDNNTVITKDEDASLPYYQNWVDAIINDPDTLPLQGVSAFVRVVMAGWASVTPEKNSVANLRHLQSDNRPFGPERFDSELVLTILGAHADDFETRQFPFFFGRRYSGATGCYKVAARIFMALGILAILVGLIRIWMGPPALTSWMGQHIYLSQSGAIALRGKAEELATGYEAASRETGLLRLPPKGHLFVASNDGMR